MFILLIVFFYFTFPKSVDLIHSFYPIKQKYNNN